MIQLQAFGSEREGGGQEEKERRRRESSARAPPADTHPSEDGLMCDGTTCQRRICSICCSARLLWQPAHPCSLFFFFFIFFFPSPHLKDASNQQLFIWTQDWDA